MAKAFKFGLVIKEIIEPDDEKRMSNNKSATLPKEAIAEKTVFQGDSSLPIINVFHCYNKQKLGVEIEDVKEVIGVRVGIEDNEKGTLSLLHRYRFSGKPNEIATQQFENLMVLSEILAQKEYLTQAQYQQQTYIDSPRGKTELTIAKNLEKDNLLSRLEIEKNGKMGTTVMLDTEEDRLKKTIKEIEDYDQAQELQQIERDRKLAGNLQQKLDEKDRGLIRAVSPTFASTQDDPAIALELAAQETSGQQKELKPKELQAELIQQIATKATKLAEDQELAKDLQKQEDTALAEKLQKEEGEHNEEKATQVPFPVQPFVAAMDLRKSEPAYSPLFFQAPLSPLQQDLLSPTSQFIKDLEITGISLDEVLEGNNNSQDDNQFSSFIKPK